MTDPKPATVQFVGDYFSLQTTILMDENLRNDAESDEDFAARLANVLLEEMYGWDVLSVSNDVELLEY